MNSNWNTVRVTVAALAFAAGGSSVSSAQCPQPIGGFYADPEVVYTLPSPPADHPPIYIGDFNADTYDDILFDYTQFVDYDDEGYRLLILLNDQAGGFVESTSSVIKDPIPSDYGGSRDIFIEDFNGDLQDDILISSHGLEIGHLPFIIWPGERTLLYLSQPDKTYNDASAQFAGFPHYTHGAAVGDIDSDGDLDLFDPHIDSELPIGGELWVNNGSGSFTDVTGRMPRHPISGLIAGCWARIFDATGDGYGDILLLASPDEGALSRSKIWINDGTGDFDRYVFDPLGPQPPNACYQEILNLPLNDDSLDDLVVHECANGFFNPCYLRALTNNGDGTFRDETARRFPDHPDPEIWTHVELIEINGDSNVDISTADVSGGDKGLRLFLNDGSENFRLLPDDFVPPGDGIAARPVTTIDVDGDGGHDLVAKCAQGGVQYVCLWRSQVPYSGSILGDGNCNKIVGGAAADSFDGQAGDDELLGGDGNDTLVGGADNDRLFGENGSDTLTGGTGTDTAGFRGPRREYLVNASGSPITVTHVAKATTDSLTEIENLEFTDMVCTNVHTAVDTDADGAPDGCDLCPGFDDTADTDADGIPNGCDVCASGDDTVDSDEDGVADACDPCYGDSISGDSDSDGVCDDLDACPGFDDALDEDNDTRPDDCDICNGGDDRFDRDGDGIPNWCDPCLGHDNGSDRDSDGVCDGRDRCPDHKIVPARDAEVCVFADGFESGDTSAWQFTEPD
jgi:hypothetical protein